MCGLSGVLDVRREATGDALAGTVEAMAATLAHRGPDGAGSWVDAGAGVALAHRRLSVIDLSEQGHQPMVSASGRYVVAYNGEIYNFRHLRRDLEAGGTSFRGHSDTEVLLAAVEAWGLDTSLGRMNGMFAFALWDSGRCQLHLVRDRLGEKPLYYAWVGGLLLFASELKALRAHPAFRPEVDRGALALYLRHNCVPAPYSIYEGTAKLPPATVLTVDGAGRGGAPSSHVVPRPYWSARSVAEAGQAARLDGDASEVADEVETLLGDAVEMQMVADVPLGAFLSGGVDSSLVVALMQARSPRPVRTFTIGFDDPAYDESADAAGVARHLGTDHTALVVSPADAMAVIPELGTLYDEPFGDSSQIPTVLVSRLARRQVTVVLSGDGGDELFAGYNRYAWSRHLGRHLRQVPRPAREAAARVLRTVPPGTWDALLRRAAPLLPRRLKVRNPGTKVQKLADVLPADSPQEMYRTLVSHWQRPGSLVQGVPEEPPSLLTGTDAWPQLADPVEAMMCLDQLSYLPDDILVKVDRASMSVGLEVRVPMLDHRLVALAWRVPPAMKLRDGRSKWLLRQMLHRHVPAELVERPKAGFGLPLGSWLRGPLRDWAEDLLDDHRLRQQGFLDAAVVRETWSRHLAGRDAEYQLWDVLMFQSWLAAQD